MVVSVMGKRLDEMDPEELRKALGVIARLPYAGMSEAHIQAVERESDRARREVQYLRLLRDVGYSPRDETHSDPSKLSDNCVDRR